MFVTETIMSTPESVERFKDLASGVQSIAVTLAVIIGGIWTLYTFSALGTKAKAEAELFQQAVLAIKVEARQEVLAGDQGLYIAAIATVENKGNRNTLVDFRKLKPFRVSPVVFDSDGRGTPDREATIEMNTDVPYITVRRGAVHSFSMFARVPAPGLYVVVFDAPLSEEEIRVHEASAHDSASAGEVTIVWSGTTYVAVK